MGSISSTTWQQRLCRLRAWLGLTPEFDTRSPPQTTPPQGALAHPATPAIADDAQVALLVSMTGGDAPKIVARMIAEIQNAKQSAIDQAAAGRWSQVKLSIHVLTNATKAMGVESLISASAQLEQDVDTPDRRGLLIPRLRAVSSAAIHALEAYLQAVDRP